jgi:hypothetical protein
MKLSEAIQERLFLKQQLDVLEARVSDDMGSKDSLVRLCEEIVSTANRLRDLEVAILWTEQQTAVGGLPLAAYRVRGDLFTRLANIHEPVDRKQADQYRRQAHADKSLAEKAVWLVELQAPQVENADEPEEEA